MRAVLELRSERGPASRTSSDLSEVCGGDQRIKWHRAKRRAHSENWKDRREPLIIINLSLPRKRESSGFKRFWIPAFAGMTLLEVARSISTLCSMCLALGGAICKE